ncbi:hypothetical protein ACFQ07_16905, partial [Actinomadura adrarensis]
GDVPRGDAGARGGGKRNEKWPQLQRGSDGRLHWKDDPDGTYRDDTYGDLHFDGDPDGTYRNEDTQRLQDKDSGKFVKDPFRKRPYDFEAVVADGPHPYTPSDQARRSIDEIATERSRIAGEKAGLQRQIEAFPGINAFQTPNAYGIESIHKLSANNMQETFKKAEQKIRRDANLDAQQKQKLLNELDDIKDLARKHAKLSLELVQTSERLGMAAAKDYATGHSGGVLVTPRDDKPGSPGTLDVTAHVDATPPRLVVVEA